MVLKKQSMVYIFVNVFHWCNLWQYDFRNKGECDKFESAGVAGRVRMAAVVSCGAHPNQY